MSRKPTKPFTPVARDTILAARARYEEGEPIAGIAARLKIATSTVARYARADKWMRPGESGTTTKRANAAASPRKDVKPAKSVASTRANAKQASSRLRAKSAPPIRAGIAQASEPPRIARRASENRSMDHAAPEARMAGLVERLFDAAERQVQAIEQRIGEPAEDAAGRERDARSLAVLTRMVKELAGLDAAASQSETAAPAAEDDDDDIERVVDDYRAKVTRILAGLAATRDEPAGPAGSDAGETGAQNCGELVLPGEG